MGVERAVVRWYAQRQLLIETLESLNAKLASDTENALPLEASTAIKAQQAETQERLRLLGSCPTPMMG